MAAKNFMRMKSLCVVIGFICTMQVTIASAHEKGHNSIKFGVFPYKSPRTIVKLFAPIAKRLETALDVKVQLVTAPDYKTFVARGKQGEYDLAFPCVSCFFEIQDAGYTVIAKGKPSFYGGTVVRKDSGIDSMAQLKGQKIASIGRHSFAGHLFILEQLHEKGVDPIHDVKFQFLGKLDTIIFGVINKKYAAGTVRLDALKSPIFKDIQHDLKFISQSSAIPQFPFVVKKDLPTAQVTKIRAILVALSQDSADDRQILKSLRVKTIDSATDSDYDLFREKFKKAQQFLH